MTGHQVIDLAEIRWYANEIENLALQIYAVEDGARIDAVRGILGGAIAALAVEGKYFSPSCPWRPCSDGSCRPICHNLGAQSERDEPGIEAAGDYGSA